MKLIILLISAFWISGCSVKDRTYTIFLEEEVVNVKNLKGEVCIVSGFQARNDRLITYYLNCDVTIVRKLKEREKTQWLQLAPNPKVQMH